MIHSSLHEMAKALPTAILPGYGAPFEDDATRDEGHPHQAVRFARDETRGGPP